MLTRPGRTPAAWLTALASAAALGIALVPFVAEDRVNASAPTLARSSGPAAVTPTGGRPFSPSSAFNTPIGSRVTLDPRSAAMVRVLASRGYATAQVYADTPAVYNATSSTSRYRIDCTMAWGTCDLERQLVPIPGGAAASTGYDQNMVVVDWSTRRVFEFWQYRNDRARASWGAVCALDGAGTGNGRVSPCRAGAVGAGISRLAGLVRTYEAGHSRLSHALVGITGNSCTSYRYPAIKSDGWSGAVSCIPEGARVQLDPRVNCDALQAPGWERMVCRTLQTYGWYNIDNGGPRGAGGFSVQFENPHGERDPYPSMGLTDYRQIRNIPLTRLRVLRAWNSSS